jgi:hypothetical protein
MDLWREHGLKLVAAFAVVVALGVLGSVLGGGGGSRGPVTTSAKRNGLGARQSPRLAARAYESADESGPPVKPVAASDSQRPAVMAAVLGFMGWYLPYSYGQPSSAPIQNVTAGEQQDLAAARPQVPPVVRRRHPRVLGVTLRPYAAGEWRAAVQVSDGTVSYTLPLILGDLPAGWEVMAIQE